MPASHPPPHLPPLTFANTSKAGPRKLRARRPPHCGRGNCAWEEGRQRSAAENLEVWAVCPPLPNQAPSERPHLATNCPQRPRPTFSFLAASASSEMSSSTSASSSLGNCIIVVSGGGQGGAEEG